MTGHATLQLFKCVLLDSPDGGATLWRARYFMLSAYKRVALLDLSHWACAITNAKILDIRSLPIALHSNYESMPPYCVLRLTNALPGGPTAA